MFFSFHSELKPHLAGKCFSVIDSTMNSVNSSIETRKGVSLSNGLKYFVEIIVFLCEVYPVNDESS